MYSSDEVKILQILLAIMFLFINCTLASAQIPEPIIQADSAILIEATTGRVIYEKNADEIRPPASMTKMMTCILGLENLTKRTPVKISEEAVYTEDNTFYWAPGDVIQADELMLGMMLVSDNGAAVAIAQAISGSVTQFANIMNEKAKELGCTSTHFANPNGLPNNNHYSTARDMARIAMYGMSVPDFRDIVSMHTAIIHWQYPTDKFSEAVTTNDLIGTYDGANGIKTGWTMAAGGCLAASAARSGTELIAIIMHSTDTNTRFNDAAKLLDYGFSRVSMVKSINKDRTNRVVFVRDGTKAIIHARPQEDLIFPLLDDENVKMLKINYDLPKIVDASIRKGEVLGKAELKYNGSVLASVPLIADESVDKGFSVASKIISIVEPVMSIAQGVLTAFFA